MLIHLIKKDVLLVSKYLIIMLAVVILFPFFILWSNSEYTFLGFMLPAVFAVFMPLQCILMKEYKYKKASAYLCSTPYSRLIVFRAVCNMLFNLFHRNTNCPQTRKYRH